jgi:hypothetical protein
MKYKMAVMIFGILKWMGYRGTLSMDNRILNILSTEKLDIGGTTEPNSVLHIQGSGNVGSIESVPGVLNIKDRVIFARDEDFGIESPPSPDYGLQVDGSGMNAGSKCSETPLHINMSYQAEIGTPEYLTALKVASELNKKLITEAEKDGIEPVVLLSIEWVMEALDGTSKSDSR